MTKLDLLVTVMQDSQWYSTENLVNRMGRRFSTTKQADEKQGYKFEVRQERQR